MVQIRREGAYYQDGAFVPATGAASEEARKGTISYQILSAHNLSGDMSDLKLRFDAMASHDITYVGIVQTARASGLTEFPLPYVMSNCHNSLCAVGGTINEDDHLFGLSAAVKYGGEYLPAHGAVIHQYMRERYAGSGKMILASDSHTRYGAYGTLAIGEAGPELVKQLLKRTYDIAYPEVVAVYLTGSPRPGVGPHDVAIALIGATFPEGIVKNRVLEFVGPGIAGLGMDYRSGIDVMTTETACLSSVWETDETVRETLEFYRRGHEYKELHPTDGAYYDAVITIDLSKVEPMIALPFHPSRAMTIADFQKNAADALRAVEKEAEAQWRIKSDLVGKLENGRLRVDQGVVVGCCGGIYQNILRMTEILKGKSIGNGAFALSVYPSSMPMMQSLSQEGALDILMAAGATIRSAFCGPCFGAGDVPGNNGFSIRHATRNFPNRDGSKPSDGQSAFVALMDARSIAATALNGGLLTAATELPQPPTESNALPGAYLDDYYQNRVYFGVGKPQPEKDLQFGPNIADWPEQQPLPENLMMVVTSAIYDPVTTTDELIPSGETSSYRSNPHKLAEFTLSRKDPAYVGLAKAVRTLEEKRRMGLASGVTDEAVARALEDYDVATTALGSVVSALSPGDGSAREQAASCQRVLGGVANIAVNYATKRYRSNLINWGMIPFQCKDLEDVHLDPGDRIYVRGLRTAIQSGGLAITATLIRDRGNRDIILQLPALTPDERDIILAGCLSNYYKAQV